MTISDAFTGVAIVSTTELSCPNGGAAYSSANGINSDGVYQVFLDVSDMVAGDMLQIRVYEKCISGLTQRIVYESILQGAQAQPIHVFPALLLLHGWDVTLDSLAGTTIVYWSIRKVA